MEGINLKRIICLAGGVGAARFLTGLKEIIPEENLTVIVNTGDDEEFYGLHVSPDLDIICYTLAGLVDEEEGWGLKDDTFNTLTFLEKYGNPTWFRIGDKDFATHIYRSQLIRQGYTLTQATAQIASRLGLRCKILPMSDSPVRTAVETEEGRMHFQEYFVREGFRPKVRAVEFEGIESAKTTPEVTRALREADGIIISPSNPIVSIGPIISLRGIKTDLNSRQTEAIAISPIVRGKTLKGPADQMMKSLGHESSVYGVAQLYRNIAGTIIIDQQDSQFREKIERLGMKCLVTNTVMSTRKSKIHLAEVALRGLEILA